ncbi:hypothetical protein [Sphingomonas hankookensis]|uniref:hypothetical protein n=1 Tax=Sphingomonas hankookensis TaxID=563996 RepID=UPI003D302AF6
MTLAALKPLGRVWWLVPIVALTVGWGVDRRLSDARLADARRTLVNERQVRALDLADAERAKLTAERDAAERVASATATYADRLANRTPIILESTNTVEKYAQTDAGRVRCRDADRVRSIDMLDARLATPAAATGGGGDPVPADAPAPAGGR